MISDTPSYQLPAVVVECCQCLQVPVLQLLLHSPAHAANYGQILTPSQQRQRVSWPESYADAKGVCRLCCCAAASYWGAAGDLQCVRWMKMGACEASRYAC
jgi:hypothetical protein